MEPTEALKPAVLWTPLEGRRVHCRLCGFNCRIAEGKLGHCAVRKNVDGKLYSLNYGKVVAGSPDPIEKKPLFHFLPGSRSFSIAAVGCNFRCEFCQNWQISQAALEAGGVEGEPIAPEQIVEAAVRTGCRSVAYTYTEPTVFMELAQECGSVAKAQGLANVFVSNGYMTREAIDYGADWLDAINVDLKAFSDEYYRNLCSARLQPVLDCISHIARHTRIWMEITTLLLPGQNDSDEELRKLAGFLVSEAGPDVPWHISRFYPQYRYAESKATSLESMRRAEEIGKAAGLRYVYLGNVPGEKSESTHCPGCGGRVIERMGYQIVANRIENSKCPHCGTEIAGFGL